MAEAGIPVHVETHRDRMATDLFVTLRLLDGFPAPRLTAASHITWSAASSLGRSRRRSPY